EQRSSLMIARIHLQGLAQQISGFREFMLVGELVAFSDHFRDRLRLKPLAYGVELDEQIFHGLTTLGGRLSQNLGENDLEFFGAFRQEGAQRGWFLLANTVHEACG